MTQSDPPAGGPTPQPPPNYLVHAILSTLMCCLPLGAVAIYYANQVNSKLWVGDHDGAREASAKARQWSIDAAVAGLLVTVGYSVYFVWQMLSVLPVSTPSF